MVQQKDQSIETLRGIAIIFLVAGHMIGSDTGTGMRVPDDSWYRYFAYSMHYLRLPLFTVISGFVYAMRPVQPGQIGTFLKKKVRRILFPLFSVSTIQFLVRLIVPAVNQPARLEDFWRIYIYPFDHFWFLQALFLIFVTVVMLDRFGLQRSIARWSFCLAGAVSVSLFMPPVTAVFSFKGYCYLLPYFILGCGMNRYGSRLRIWPVAAFVGACFAAGMVIQQMAWFNIMVIHETYIGFLSLLVGLSSTFLLVYARLTVRTLGRLGSFAYTIYLFHVFGSAGVKIGLSTLGISNREVWFAAGLLCGLFMPVVIHKVLEKSVPLRRIVLGLK